MSEFSPFSAEMSDMELAVTKSRIKGWRRKRRRSRHFCPQCGQLTGVSTQAVVAPFEQTFGATGVFVPASAGASTKTSVPYGRLEGMMSKNENSLNFRMTDETAAKIERWYQKDNCRSKNEFIEKAVNCYADMLAAGESTALPRAVQSAIDSRLKLFENRIASLLYKQAVEMDMAMSILLQSVNVSEEVLRQERAKSIAAVKRTNGQLRLEQKLRELESEAWQG